MVRKKLPKSLRKKWINTLKKEYNIKGPEDIDKLPFPTEFNTDEWWKKRGL